jgi:hypothetical protein
MLSHIKNAIFEFIVLYGLAQVWMFGMCYILE